MRTPDMGKREEGKTDRMMREDLWKNLKNGKILHNNLDPK